MVRLLLVDDHQIILDGLKHLLENAGHMVIDQANNFEQGRTMIRSSAKAADFLILDLQLPDGDGADLCSMARKLNPDLKILALSMLDDAQTAYDFLKKGGNGFISKGEFFEQVLTAIQVVQSGEVYLNDKLKPLVLNQLSQTGQSYGRIHSGILTKREKEILTLIRDELNLPQICERLQIAESTVISHRKALLYKLQAKNTAGLINAIYKYRLLD